MSAGRSDFLRNSGLSRFFFASCMFIAETEEAVTTYILLVLVPLKLLTRNVNTGIVRIVGRPIGFSSRLPLPRPRPRTGAGGRVVVGVRVGYPE